MFHADAISDFDHGDRPAIAYCRQTGHCIAFDAAAAMMAKAVIVSACFALAHCYAPVSSFQPHAACADRRRSPSRQPPPPPLPPPPPPTTSSICRQMIGTGFNFDDGDQILVSAQKPLGIILEEKEEGGGCVVAEFADPSTSAVAKAGVEVGDWLQAINNADVSKASIEEVMKRIITAPKVVNLRFQRPWRERE